MKLKYFVILPLLFTFSFVFSQSDKHNSWIIELGDNVNNPFTNQEIKFIKSALSEQAYNRVINIKALEQNIKDILRNRVQILNKKYQRNENLPKLSSVRSSITTKKFNKNNFNPLLYNFDFDSQKTQIYRIDGTDLVVNIIPKKTK